MSLTPAQQTTLLAVITANGTLNAQPLNADGDYAIAALLNGPPPSAFWVFNPAVSIEALIGAFDATEFMTLTTAQIGLLTIIMGASTFSMDASVAQRRNQFINIFASCPTTKTNLGNLAHRAATWIEQILSTGTGTTNSPATMSYVGQISLNDIAAVRGG